MRLLLALISLACVACSTMDYKADAIAKTEKRSDINFTNVGHINRLSLDTDVNFGMSFIIDIEK